MACYSIGDNVSLLNHVLGVLACSRAWRAYVLAYLRAWRAYVLACLFDTPDSLLFESQIEGLVTGSFPGGDGPCQGKRSSTRENKDILLAEDIGRDLLDFRNRITSPEVTKKLFTKANEDCKPPKRKKNDGHMLEKRIETVKAHVGNIKVTNTKTINSFRREYSITSRTSGRTRYVVKICWTP